MSAPIKVNTGTQISPPDAPQAKSGGRAYNFSAGPGPLPTAVMEKAQREFSSWSDQPGIGVLELTNLDAKGPTHPGVPETALQAMVMKTEAKLRAVLNIPDNYKVLFMHGGAVGQFSAVPMNLCGDPKLPNNKADYALSGMWGARALAEGGRFCDAHVCVELGDDGLASKPLSSWNVRPESQYVHVTLNETVAGRELREDFLESWPAEWPPLVGDVTSTLLSRPIDVSKFAVLYASGGKNLPAGLTTVIVRESFLTDRVAHPFTPSVLDYRMSGGSLSPSPSHFESRPNTPPVFGIWMLSLILDHICEAVIPKALALHPSSGGGALSGTTSPTLAPIAAYVDGRAAALYAAIDGSQGYYRNSVAASLRSRMSVIFRIGDGDRDLEATFATEAAEEAGLFFLFGHPAVGGMRVSLYLGVDDEALAAVIAFMAVFAQRHPLTKGST